MRSPALSLAVALMLAGHLPARAQDEAFELKVQVQQDGSTFDTRASFKLPLTLCQAWDYIVDYDAAIHIPGVVYSQTTRLGPSSARVERTLKEIILFFPIRMRSVMEFTEIAGKGTDFSQIEGEARSHRGSWRLESAQDGTVFRYHAVSEPDSSLPMTVIRYFVDKRLRSSFSAMAQQGVRQKDRLCRDSAQRPVK